MKPHDNIAQYVLAIRNPHKRAYAAAWYGYKQGLLDHMPEKPSELSSMAAQAVRLRITADYDEATATTSDGGAK